MAEERDRHDRFTDPTPQHPAQSHDDARVSGAGGHHSLHGRAPNRIELRKIALLKVKIDTGRTHQIRVHLASIGHPVVGDTVYGAPEEIGAQSGKEAWNAAVDFAGPEFSPCR